MIFYFYDFLRRVKVITHCDLNLASRIFSNIQDGERLESLLFSISETIHVTKILCTTQPKVHNLFRVVKNSIEQCCAAHIVQCCQQYCSALLRLIAG